MLHVFRIHKNLWFAPIHGRNLKQEIGETTLALAEACIRCARHSQQLLTDSWIDGSFAIFDYTYTQYLFSSTSILAISSLSIGRTDQEDKDAFENAYQFLDQLKRNGNYAALESCYHLDLVRIAMVEFLSRNGGRPIDMTAASEPGIMEPPPLTGNVPSTTPSLLGSGAPTPLSGYQTTMTTEMALAEPSLQDFLSQAELDLGFLDTQMHESDFQSLYVQGVAQDDSWNAK